jgi:hypothetical protein
MFVHCADVDDWRIDSIHGAAEAPVAAAARLSMVSGPTKLAADIAWTLQDLTSNERYVIRDEKKQGDVGRASSCWAAVILIRKNFAWWALTQDEIHAIFEDPRDTSRSAWRICLPSRCDCTIAAISGPSSPSTFSPSSNLPLTTARRSTSWRPRSGGRRSGAMSIARSIRLRRDPNPS